MAIKSTQKAKLSLRAQELALTKDIKDDYYLTVKLQKCLSLKEIAEEVAAMSTRQEEAEEVERITKRSMEVMEWFLSAGYSISTPMGYFRPTVSGVMLESELVGSPNRDCLSLGVSYSMSEGMRQALADAELDVEIQKAAVGPQIYQVLNIQDAQNPDAITRGEGTGITAGENCVIKGKKLKVGGTGENIGVTLTRQDDSSKETFFFPPSKLYPNTATQVGFIMPASAVEGSVWSVTLCTQLGSSGELLKEARTVTMTDYFVVGKTASAPTGGGTTGGDVDENPFG